MKVIKDFSNLGEDSALEVFKSGRYKIYILLYTKRII